MLIDPLGSRPKPDPAQTRQVKEWATAAFELNEAVSVMVTELSCTEPGCPPLETVIVVLEADNPTRQYKLHKAIAEVERQDLDILATRQHPDSH